MCCSPCDCTFCVYALHGCDCMSCLLACCCCCCFCCTFRFLLKYDWASNTYTRSGLNNVRSKFRFHIYAHFGSTKQQKAPVLRHMRKFECQFVRSFDRLEWSSIQSYFVCGSVSFRSALAHSTRAFRIHERVYFYLPNDLDCCSDARANIITGFSLRISYNTIRIFIVYKAVYTHMYISFCRSVHKFASEQRVLLL